MSVPDVTFEQASPLQLPRTIGADPETGEEIVAANGRFGPFLKRGSETRSLETEDQLFTVTIEEALSLFSAPKQRRYGTSAAPLRELGADPESGTAIVLRSGRFGPYVSDGTTNASLRRGDDPEELTLERALELISDRRAAGPAKRAGTRRASRRTRRRAPARRPPRRSLPLARQRPARRLRPRKPRPARRQRPRRPRRPRKPLSAELREPPSGQRARRRCRSPKTTGKSLILARGKIPWRLGCRSLTETASRGPQMTKKLVAEGLGTFVLVFFAVGSAVGGINVIGDAGVAFAFGFVLLRSSTPSGPCRVVT